MNNHLSNKVKFFAGEVYPDKDATLIGYSALIENYQLNVVIPKQICAVVSKKTNNKVKGRWLVFGSTYKSDNTLFSHLVFAFKYEGLELAILNQLFQKTPIQEMVELIQNERTGSYSRRIWFLYEWLTVRRLDLPDLDMGNYVDVVNSKQQYTGPTRKEPRYRVNNNLPGVRNFCPLIRKTTVLEEMITSDLPQQALNSIGNVHKDLLSRAAAFLLLSDSKASYTIEGESPPHNRIERWGKIIGQAGSRQLSIDEIERLQNIVIPDGRFILPGIRLAGGFIGDHDRTTNIPLPAHISAKVQDLELLLNAYLETYDLLLNSDFDPVLMAAVIAFGFVFIHPLEDGNGRIHRYLFHHVLADKSFVPKGLVFPVSSVILEKINEYKEVLEQYSKPRLDLIEWHPTIDGNVDVKNETIDLYRYCDLTPQSEFLYECVKITVLEVLPKEVNYLHAYDSVYGFINNNIDMPNKMISLLINFLKQNNGRLSKRAKENEFELLSENEILAIEEIYQEAFSIKIISKK